MLHTHSCSVIRLDSGAFYFWIRFIFQRNLQLVKNEVGTQDYVIETLDDWNVVCVAVIEKLESFPLVLLTGNLGAGKTAFVKKMALHLDVIDDVTSPTYSIVQEYQTTDSKVIYHLDLYRLLGYDEVIGAGIEDLIDNGDYYCMFIEWPEIFLNDLDKPYLEINITGDGDNVRNVVLRYMK